ncbi:MAG: tryptophan synthase subunit alpha [Nitrosopumilaceae archaeon]
MSKIKDKFLELAAKNQKALIAYVMVGYPSMKGTFSAVRGLVNGGVDIIELGMPFSDPLADGPIIQNASTVSLQKGITLEQFFSTVKKIRKETDLPLVLMTYTNLLYRQGYKKFMSMAKKVGIDGFVLPDMSLEESKEYLKAARQKKVDTIFLASPNTDKQRMKKISRACSGFLYLVSLYGTTGKQQKIQQYTLQAIKNAKKIVDKKIPFAVGFGISNSSQARKFIKLGADGVIVGSAFLRLMENTSSREIESKTESFARSLKKATRIQ